MAEVGQRKREREDKRNVYLLREGLITSKSEAAKNMAEIELRKRDASFSTRKKLLANNPDLYVSKTRLSIRNLPVRVTDEELRKLATGAIDKFKTQVREKAREHLSPSEREEGWDKRARVTQAKVIRSKDRIDAASGLSRSKGYAFVEFTTHAHALAALRYLNNNPDLFGDRKRLLVEFSLENTQVVKRREDRRARSRLPPAEVAKLKAQEAKDRVDRASSGKRKSREDGGGREGGDKRPRREGDGGARGGRGRGGGGRGGRGRGGRGRGGQR